MRTMYECEYCGKLYDEEPYANRCEINHEEGIERLRVAAEVYISGDQQYLVVEQSLDYGEVSRTYYKKINKEEVVK